jgi:hypothetical protein
VIAEEFKIARDALANGKIGRSRTAARRAIGMAMQQTVGIGPQGGYAKTFIDGLKRLADDPQMPEAIRAAATRLITRVDREYNSPAINPVADAEIIIAYFLPDYRASAAEAEILKE